MPLLLPSTWRPRRLTPGGLRCAAALQVKLQSQSINAMGAGGFKGPMDATRQVGRCQQAARAS
jgi:hypothetical protein